MQVRADRWRAAQARRRCYSSFLLCYHLIPKSVILTELELTTCYLRIKSSVHNSEDCLLNIRHLRYLGTETRAGYVFGSSIYWSLVCTCCAIANAEYTLIKSYRLGFCSHEPFFILTFSISSRSFRFGKCLGPSYMNHAHQKSECTHETLVV